MKSTIPSALYKLNDDYRPLRISNAGEVGSMLAGAPLAFAGYGISAPDKGYDDYAGLDVKGKIVLVIRTEPETKDGKRIGDKEAPEKGPNPHRGLSLFSDFYYKASTARDKGAVGMVIVNGVRDMSNSERAVLEDFNRSGNKTDCGIPFIQVFPEVAEDWLRPAGKTIGDLQKAIDEKLESKSFEIKGVSLALNVDIQRERAKDENLIVVLPGNDPVLKDEIVVIGAHYDHLGRGNEFSLADKTEMGQIHRGADDNASGVSSVLEVADALYKNRAGLKRTVWIMFFGAEELGTLGSNDFVKSPPPDFAVNRCAAMLNLDMVGRSKERKVMVYGAATGIGFEDVIKKANEGLDLSIKTTADGFGGSDQTAFVNAGVPVMFFFTGSHSDYHKPSDSADKLNVNDQATITALVFKAAAQVINAPERPKFVKLEAPKMSGGIGGVGLGTLPDYAFEGKGLRLSGVRAASAADKAGLKMGDIITKLADRKIENIYDYMNALRQCVAGVETGVTINRDGKEMEIKITPEKR
jgi:aminopeptidase YwaD